MIATIDLGIDASTGPSLRDLAAFQARDPKILRTVEKVKPPPEQSDGRNLTLRDILFTKDSKNYRYWRPVLTREIEAKGIKFVDVSFGNLGTEKCIAQVAITFHVRYLGREDRKLISRYDICQRFPHPNRSYVTECRSHTPAASGDLCPTDLFGPLPVCRGGERYILIILNVITNFVKTHPLRADTTRACKNKVTIFTCLTSLNPSAY
jgi:hypothetical protein